MGVGDGGFSGMMPCLRRISFLGKEVRHVYYGECICGKLHTIQCLRSGHLQARLFAPPPEQPFRADQSSGQEENVKEIKVLTELRTEQFVSDV